MFKESSRHLFQQLIVSCQSEGTEAFYDLRFTFGMIQAALEGGAGGLRVDSPRTVQVAKALSNVPIIGIWKQRFPDSEVTITPTYQAARAVMKAGADIVALDATSRPRPEGQELAKLVKALKAKKACLMADISTLEEGLQAERLGFDCLGTTLSGYTPYSLHQEGPDFKLLTQLIQQVSIPVVMEGRIWTPEQARQALDLGAFAVVVGSAITRPQAITRHFVASMRRI